MRILNLKRLQKRNLQPQRPQRPQRKKRKNRNEDSQFKTASEKEFTTTEPTEATERKKEKNRDEDSQFKTASEKEFNAETQRRRDAKTASGITGPSDEKDLIASRRKNNRILG
jgi:hypothetical protein